MTLLHSAWSQAFVPSVPCSCALIHQNQASSWHGKATLEEKSKNGTDTNRPMSKIQGTSIRAQGPHCLYREPPAMLCDAKKLKSCFVPLLRRWIRIVCYSCLGLFEMTKLLSKASLTLRRLLRTRLVRVVVITARMTFAASMTITMTVVISLVVLAW